MRLTVYIVKATIAERWPHVDAVSFLPMEAGAVRILLHGPAVDDATVAQVDAWVRSQPASGMVITVERW